MTTLRTAEKLGPGVHVRLEPEVLGRIDEAAGKAGVSRSEFIRRMIEDWAEQQAEMAWVEEEAEAALREERVPWEQAKAELGP